MLSQEGIVLREQVVSLKMEREDLMRRKGRDMDKKEGGVKKW